ncbi:hypothetical protein UPYG_G00296350 [Umbra pygmaea]|uniref:Uncharacterized protein n=1 Tax=Umbra pygmaea TaxID=75934 RepID=A0ABD0W9Z2_UMBPY
MEETDAFRVLLPRPAPTEDNVSLSNPINIEDGHYSALQAELEADAQDLDWESWSASLDQQDIKTLPKDAVKRQDVIYEFIQTEAHHVRNLKVLLSVYRYEVRRILQMDETKLDRMFPQIDSLLQIHQQFLYNLRECQDRENHYVVNQLGDVLINQFSDKIGERLKESYGVFCSHHTDAVCFYKAQLQKNKNFQNLMTRISRLPIVNRLGVPECLLLVTQRITKYPVLVERILQNTDASSEEYVSLTQALVRIREVISAVDSHVHDYERASRLRDIASRLEARSYGRLSDGRVFKKEDLASRTLLYEGAVSLRAGNGRVKDVHAVLLSDFLLLLQKEKDNRFIFANVDKPSVISLQMLITRETAKYDNAMYLISVSTSLMYEIHTTSKDERDTWMSLIRYAVDSCPRELDDATQAKLREFQEDMYKNDALIVQGLTEKLQIFAKMVKETGLTDVANCSQLLLRGDDSDLHQGATLLNKAITEVENLQLLLLASETVPQPSLVNHLEGQGQFDLRPGVLQLDPGVLENLVPLSRSQTFGGYDCSPVSPIKSGSIESGKCPSGDEGRPLDRRQQLNSDPQLQDVEQPEGFEQSADEEPAPGISPWSNLSFLKAELLERVLLLSQILNSLVAAIALQDSSMDILRATLSEYQRSGRPHGNALLDQEKQRNLEKQREEMANFQKLQTQHAQEQARWEKEKARHQQQEALKEEELKRQEEECRRMEEKIAEEKKELQRQREDYQQDLERLRESLRSVEKEKERLEQQTKLKKNNTFSINASSAQQASLVSQSFRGTIPHSTSFHECSTSVRENKSLSQSSQREHWSAGDVPTIHTFKVQDGPSHPKATTFFIDQPPEVPPRRTSIFPVSPKPDLPIQLISTTNQVVHKPGSVQQQIPSKLASSKNKEKTRKKRSHQRTQSAASIDMSLMVPITVMGKEGGSLKGKKTGSSHKNYQSEGLFKPSEPLSSAKPSQSHTLSSGSTKINNYSPPILAVPTPPTPPPFPKDIIQSPPPPTPIPKYVQAPPFTIEDIQSFPTSPEDVAEPSIFYL